MRNLGQVLVLILILGVSAGLVLCGFGWLQDRAIQTGCRNNLRQLGLALHNYSDSGGGRFPAGAVGPADLPPERRIGWLPPVYPYVEQDSLWKRFDANQPWDAEANRQVLHHQVHSFLCPALPEAHRRKREPNDAGQPGLASYLGIGGLGPDAALLPRTSPRAGLFGYDIGTTWNDIKDGTSTTLAVSETVSVVIWAEGGAATVRVFDPSGRPHVGPNGQFNSRHIR